MPHAPPPPAAKKNTSHVASISSQRVFCCAVLCQGDHIPRALGMAPLCSACSVSTHRVIWMCMTLRARLSEQVGDRSPTHSMWSSYVAVVELIHYACCVSGWSSTFHACRGDCVSQQNVGERPLPHGGGLPRWTASTTRGALPRFSAPQISGILTYCCHTHTHMEETNGLRKDALSACPTPLLPPQQKKTHRTLQASVRNDFSAARCCAKATAWNRTVLKACRVAEPTRAPLRT